MDMGGDGGMQIGMTKERKKREKKKIEVYFVCMVVMIPFQLVAALSRFLDLADLFPLDRCHFSVTTDQYNFHTKNVLHDNILV
jgi:hypothetical protein